MTARKAGIELQATTMSTKVQCTKTLPQAVI